jgi:DNA-binding NarL/FixJ family response regulator
MARVTVLLVDDDPLVRAGLRLILSSAADIEIVGESDDGIGAVAAVRQHRPDVVLMDIRMPQLDGIAATAALRTLNPAPQIIVLTTFRADEHVVAALRAGASGFLVKDTPPADIITAVRLVAAGDAIVSPLRHPHPAVPLRQHRSLRTAPTGRAAARRPHRPGTRGSHRRQCRRLQRRDRRLPLPE